MDDGAGYHNSKKTAKWRQKRGLNRMSWPAQSPDLNPIENLWRIIKIRVSAQRHRIYSLEEMEKVIEEEWDKLTEEDFRKCIESMHRRCKLLILARGGAIKYQYTHLVDYWKLYCSFMYLIINVWCCNFITKFRRGIAKLKWG